MFVATGFSIQLLAVDCLRFQYRGGVSAYQTIRHDISRRDIAKRKQFSFSAAMAADDHAAKRKREKLQQSHGETSQTY